MEVGKLKRVNEINEFSIDGTLAGNSDVVVPTEKAVKTYVDGLKVKGWVSFNGTGTPTIIDSYNVSSITDLAEGKYRINWTTAFANANYVVVATCGHGGETDLVMSTQAFNTAYADVWCKVAGGALYDSVRISVIAIGLQ